MDIEMPFTHREEYEDNEGAGKDILKCHSGEV